MPELPEAESARLVIENLALHRRIGSVDDVDPYVARPERPATFSRALVGGELTQAQRQGKSLRVTTAHDGIGGASLGLHLGMGGRLVVVDAAGEIVPGGDSTHGLAGAHAEKWDRFTLRFHDGGALHLVDKRRLGRAVLNPDLSRLGPDAMEVNLATFRRRLGTSSAPIKARLINQAVIAGVGNLIADETLWRARIDPVTPTRDLSAVELAGLHRSLRSALRNAIRRGGSHAGNVIPARHPAGRCPRCGAPMQWARIGGRSTWSCSKEQSRRQ
ncbi:MAG: formamidopyrimidine-DNA glycosylase [Actinomycetota bacterium]|nr:formamidopyrimidine-DNA glycosylase [Actinomycetota bacterium]